MKWRSMGQAIVHRGGLRLVNPCKTERAMQPIVRGVSSVSKVEDVHLHTRLFCRRVA